MVVTGRISFLDDTDSEPLAAELPALVFDKTTLPLRSGDIYKDLGLRGYDYKGVFRGVKEADSEGNGRCLLRTKTSEMTVKLNCVSVLCRQQRIFRMERKLD